MFSIFTPAVLFLFSEIMERLQSIHMRKLWNPDRNTYTHTALPFTGIPTCESNFLHSMRHRNKNCTSENLVPPKHFLILSHRVQSHHDALVIHYSVLQRISGFPKFGLWCRQSMAWDEGFPYLQKKLKIPFSLIFNYSAKVLKAFANIAFSGF